MRVISALIFVIALCFGINHVQADELPIELQLLPPGRILVVLEDRLIHFRPLDEQNAVYHIPIAVGRPGMDAGIIGEWEITRKEEWPTWTPPEDMIERRPELAMWTDGMPGGFDNPLGARALYLGDSLYRIHGTNEPDSIGKAVSSGCICTQNEDVVWLYNQVNKRTKVTVVRHLTDYPAVGTYEEAHEEADGEYVEEEVGDPEPLEGVEDFYDDTPINSTGFVHPFYD